MSVFEISGGRVTYRYLMNKTKHEIASLALDYLCRIEALESERDTLRTTLLAARERIFHSPYEQLGDAALLRQIDGALGNG